MRNFFCILLVFYSLSFIAQTSPCAKTSNFHLVVLGSSTAAGSGPSSPDSAWVNRYRKYIQNINPGNQVTNLAIGGTNTYKIMPDWFTPPTGRPSTNPSNNISQAVRLNADVIIVNMPSNDAASGYDVNEQMSNFITMKLVADSFNIPIYICTTQPRNFSAAQKLIQTQTRDSVLKYFGNQAIDFWTGFADTTNSIKSIFDSGDGVHMNDSAHNRLNQIAIGLDLPSMLADTLSFTDYAITKTQAINPTICGKTNQTFQFIYANGGIFNTDSFRIKFSALELINNIQIDSTIIKPFGLNPCTSDTLNFQFDNSFKSKYVLNAFIVSNDSIKQNDTAKTTTINSLGTPSINPINDTVCLGNPAYLTATKKNINDSIIWYPSPTSNTILYIGDTLPLGVLNSDSTLYAESVRGPLHFRNSLFTTNSTTTNWNGIMFNIVPKDSLIIDSLSVKLFDTGNQNVIAYYRMGSYIGHEANSASWTQWGNIPVTVNNAGEFGILDLSDLSLKANDTLGVYLHLQSSGARLSYLNASATNVASNNRMEIPAGTGIGHTFGTTYTPRHFSGEIFYHHGFNPMGDCSTGRNAIHATVSNPNFDLGADSSILSSLPYLLQAPNAQSYLWSNGSTQNQLLIDTINFQLGLNLISLTITDFQGCTYTDTINITIVLGTGIEEKINSNFSFSPNPSNGLIRLNGNISSINRIDLIDIKGKLIMQINKPKAVLNFTSLPKGVYMMRVNSVETIDNFKLIIE